MKKTSYTKPELRQKVIQAARMQARESRAATRATAEAMRGAKQPERVNIEVLRDMITESPETMAVAARRWLKNEDSE